MIISFNFSILLLPLKSRCVLKTEKKKWLKQMWLLKLQYEFYNPRFYGTERNFSHQGQRQEKWDRISEMGWGRGEGFRMTKTAHGANFLTFTSLSNLWDQLQNVTLAAFSPLPKAKSPTATQVWLSQFPSLQPPFPPPYPQSILSN